MKQFMKKSASVCTAILCTAALTMGGACAVLAEEIDDSMREALVETFEGLTEVVVSMSDEDIASYTENGDDFTVALMEAWTQARDELGEFTGTISADEVEVACDDGEYTVTVPAEFADADAEFVYIYDEEEQTPTSVTVNVNYSFGETMRRAAMNTLMGIGTVCVVLVFLIFVISLFKYIPGLFEKKKPGPETQSAAAPTPAPASPSAAFAEAPAPASTPQDDTQLIAVITAAIAASEGKTSTEGYVVRSIRKVNRKKR
ncbi:MAG: OadG family protein [Clostridiales bacterium]|nr:OadG family protein [Clostridiales bacterium]